MPVMYARERDKNRIEKLAARETRAPVDQLALIVDEACERRGLDPETLEPRNGETTPEPSANETARQSASHQPNEPRTA